MHWTIMELLFQFNIWSGYMEEDNTILLALACTLSMTCFHPIIIKKMIVQVMAESTIR
jgi:hypothetical protein